MRLFSWGLPARRVAIRRSDLAAFFDEHDVVVGAVAVDEVAEAFERLRIVDRFAPLALVAVDDPRHVGFQLGGDAELVVDHHLLQVVAAAFEIIEPHGGALQTVGGADIEHQEAVDVADQRAAVQTGREQVGVPRFHAAVAADVQVPALLGRDDADILALRFGALARAAGDRELELVRSAQALVTILQIDRVADAVLHAVAAPRRSHARFYGAHRLAVGVTGFEACVDQLFPDQRQLMHLRAEQIDALAAGDLGVQAVLLRDGADSDE